MFWGGGFHLNAAVLQARHLSKDGFKPKSYLIMCDSGTGATHGCFLDGLAPSKTCPHVFLVLPLLQLLSGHQTQTAILLRRWRMYFTRLISSFFKRKTDSQTFENWGT